MKRHDKSSSMIGAVTTVLLCAVLALAGCSGRTNSAQPAPTQPGGTSVSPAPMGGSMQSALTVIGTSTRH